jgi:electron transport complex protein RnfB
MARTRYAFHSLKRPQNKGDSPKKLEESEEETAPQALQQAPGLPARPETDAAVAERKRAVIEAALARARAQRLHKA